MILYTFCQKPTFLYRQFPTFLYYHLYKYLEQLAKEHKNIKIIDWYSLISKHPEWLAEDGIHPNDEGVKAYAQLVRTSMEKDLEEDEK